VLFGDAPQATLEHAKRIRADGFAAAKFGWGPIGRGSAAADCDQLMAAREGLGHDALLLVDVGQIFIEDVERAAERLPALEAARATWLEEPFQASAYASYAALAKRSSKVKLAGGEGAHEVHMARHLIDYGGVGYIQIDCGRIGGIGPAKKIADYAAPRGVTYVNHTFTSNLALSASLQPYAGLADHRICEYPVKPQPMAWEMCANHIAPDRNGEILVPDAPGLGIEVDLAALKKYSVDVEIRVKDKVLYRSPAIG
jgi:L-alanine-DL-glutamate epimerase-like enolase superfamily enzyme